MPRPEPTSRRSRNAWGWTHNDQPRERLALRIARIVVRWRLAVAASILVVFELVVHEAIYHGTGKDDFPLTVLFNQVRVFVVSHGGLDALVVGGSVVLLIVVHGLCVRYVEGAR